MFCVFDLLTLVLQACISVVEPLDDAAKFAVDNVRTIKVWTISLSFWHTH